MHAALDDWIQSEAISFSADSPTSFNDTLEKVMASLGDSVELLGFGEALHGGEEILLLRNRLFQRLVEAHGYSAIALESSFPRGRVTNDFVSGHGPASYEAVQEVGFSHGFGRLEANRALVEWMREYNADPAHRVKLRFYGFDLPGLTGVPASPSQVLHFVLDYLTAMDGAARQEHRHRLDALIGEDADWENTAALMDPAKAVGLSPAATSLRIETEDLITELRTRGPELIAKTSAEQYAEALHHAVVARQLLNFHAGIARKADYASLLGIRDVLIADNLAYIVARERDRGGKVLAFAHNGHLQRGRMKMQLGAQFSAWWPAGAHLHEMLGSSRYAVIGSAVGVSDANGISNPESGTLEARLTAMPGPVRLIPTHSGEGLPAEEIATLPIRSGSKRNPTYVPLTAQSFTDFDWLAVLDSTTYNRGGPPLPS